MNSMNDKEEENIRKWFDVTGYPLEMRAYNKLFSKFYNDRDFTSQGIHTSITPAYFYSDPNKLEPREADAFVLFSKRIGAIFYQMSFCIECKGKIHGSKPWLLLKTEKNYNLWDHNYSRVFSRLAEGFPENEGLAGMKGMFQTKEPPDPAYNLVRMKFVPRIEEESSDKGEGKNQPKQKNNNTDDAYSATAQLLSACLARKLNADEDFDEYPRCEIITPILLVEDNIYYCHLNNGQLELAKTDYGIVELPLPMSGLVRTSLVYVVTEAYFESFLSIIRDSVDSFMRPYDSTSSDVIARREQILRAPVPLPDDFKP